MTPAGRALLALAVLAAGIAPATARQDTTVRITSPLGRTGVPGVIRVVAQVQTNKDGGVVPVRFFVDGAPIGQDVDGPPGVQLTQDAGLVQGRRRTL